MKRTILAVVLAIFACFIVYGQSSPIDLILLLDTSTGMSSSYDNVNDYLTSGFLTEYLRVGDTFHLIAFSGTQRLDVARRINGIGDVEAIIGRMLLQYPVETGSNIGGVLTYAEQYITSLPSRPKKIVLITTGGSSSASDVNNLINASRQRLNSGNATIDYIQVVPGQRLSNLPSSGRPPISGTTTPATTAGTTPSAATGQTQTGQTQTGQTQTGQTQTGQTQTGQTQTGQTQTGQTQTGQTQTGQTQTGQTQTGQTQTGQTQTGQTQTGQTQTGQTQTGQTQTGQTQTGQTQTGQTQTGQTQTGQTQTGQTQTGQTETADTSTETDSSDSSVTSESTQPVTSGGTQPSGDQTRQRDSDESWDPTILLIILGILLALFLLGLLIFFASRKLKSKPNRIVAEAAYSGQASRDKPVDHSKDLAKYASGQSRRTTPYDNRPAIVDKSKPVEINPTGPLLLNLYVEDQNTAIGKRNIHSLKSGYKFSLGGGKSDDFLIFLVPMPANIGEIRRNGSQLTFIPRKPKYFPDIGSSEVSDCINKTIRIVSDRNYEMRFRFEMYEDPIIALNNMLNSVNVPG